eukprot:CAMPEP_0194241276 /NCGR_PEP_ID=MMETSP0158-20130606/7190_1 /TAXON_ID=33649 /ORGANISM="Thalassionema nitzschioides, Strain L26-B" /LENGTH=169 /DNA_ID=CAMNT_0038976133 /DNA_START=489 /DNA_END=998 /DNA_ORIENTATION=-
MAYPPANHYQNSVTVLNVERNRRIVSMTVSCPTLAMVRRCDKRRVGTRGIERHKGVPGCAMRVDVNGLGVFMPAVRCCGAFVGVHPALHLDADWEGAEAVVTSCAVDPTQARLPCVPVCLVVHRFNRVGIEGDELDQGLAEEVLEPPPDRQDLRTGLERILEDVVTGVF